MFNLRKTTTQAQTAELAIMPSDGTLDYETLTTMLDNMPINVMMANPEDLKINYINRTSVETLKTVRDLLPADVDPEKMMCFTSSHFISDAFWPIRPTCRTTRKSSSGPKHST